MVRFQVIRASHIVMAAFVFLIAVAVVGFMVRVLPAISAAGETPEPVSAPIVVDHQVSLEDGRAPALFSPQDSAKPSRGQGDAVSREQAALDILASDEPDDVIIQAAGDGEAAAANPVGSAGGMDASGGDAGMGTTGGGDAGTGTSGGGDAGTSDANAAPARTDTPSGAETDAREATNPTATDKAADAVGKGSVDAQGTPADAANGTTDEPNEGPPKQGSSNQGVSNQGASDQGSSDQSSNQGTDPNAAPNAESDGASATPNPGTATLDPDATPGANIAAVEVDPAYRTSSAPKPEDSGAVEVFISLVEEHEEADPSDHAAMQDAEEIRIEMPGTSPRIADGSPSVLLYHTHTHEAYAQVSSDPYVEAGKWRSSDDLHNIVRVGDALTTKLEASGFAVTHDETDHEPPKLGTAYTRSLATLEGYGDAIKAYDWVIDLHRDAYSESQKQLTVNYNGAECARLMMLIGTGEGDEKSQFTIKPNWKVNYQLAQQLTDELNRICPGICRPVMIKTGRYNQHMSERGILVEVGNNRNTLAQAENSMAILAEAMNNLSK